MFGVVTCALTSRPDLCQPATPPGHPSTLTGFRTGSQDGVRAGQHRADGDQAERQNEATARLTNHRSKTPAGRGLSCPSGERVSRFHSESPGSFGFFTTSFAVSVIAGSHAAATHLRAIGLPPEVADELAVPFACGIGPAGLAIRFWFVVGMVGLLRVQELGVSRCSSGWGADASSVLGGLGLSGVEAS